jgi:hypothetical protein
MMVKRLGDPGGGDAMPVSLLHAGGGCGDPPFAVEYRLRRVAAHRSLFILAQGNDNLTRQNVIGERAARLHVGQKLGQVPVEIGAGEGRPALGDGLKNPVGIERLGLAANGFLFRPLRPLGVEIDDLRRNLGKFLLKPGSFLVTRDDLPVKIAAANGILAGKSSSALPSSKSRFRSA